NQATGTASGNVTSRPTVVASSARITPNVNEPTSTSSSRCVNDHHVAASRHGWSRSRITPPTLSSGGEPDHGATRCAAGGAVPPSPPCAFRYGVRTLRRVQRTVTQVPFTVLDGRRDVEYELLGHTGVPTVIGVLRN